MICRFLKESENILKWARNEITIHIKEEEFLGILFLEEFNLKFDFFEFRQAFFIFKTPLELFKEIRVLFFVKLPKRNEEIRKILDRGS